jgi:hypothetical protein
MPVKRITFKLNKGTKRWERINFEELKIGDTFKMYEPVCGENDQNVFVADSDPYPMKDNKEILTIKVK